MVNFSCNTQLYPMWKTIVVNPFFVKVSCIVTCVTEEQ
jgi:hypothetical protein